MYDNEGRLLTGKIQCLFTAVVLQLVAFLRVNIDSTIWPLSWYVNKVLVPYSGLKIRSNNEFQMPSV